MSGEECILSSPREETTDIKVRPSWESRHCFPGKIEEYYSQGIVET